LDKGIKIQRKKMRDQSVFSTKQWRGKRQIILHINRWLSHTRKEGGPKNKRKKKQISCSHNLSLRTQETLILSLQSSYHSQKKGIHLAINSSPSSHRVSQHQNHDFRPTHT
jgi:hypothetical protein